MILKKQEKKIYVEINMQWSLGERIFGSFLDLTHCRLNENFLSRVDKTIGFVWSGWVKSE